MLLPSNLFTKLFFAFLLCSMIVAAGIAISTQWSFQRGFLGYLKSVENERVQQFIPILIQFYKKNANWNMLKTERHAWRQLVNQGLGDDIQHTMPHPPKLHEDFDRPPPPPHDHFFEPEHHEHRHPPKDPPSPFALKFRVRLLNPEKQPIAGHFAPVSAEEELIPLKIDEQLIAWLSVKSLDIQTDHLATSFLAQQIRWYYVIAILAVFSAALASYFLARQLLHPIHNLASAARALGAGLYHTRVTICGGDELSQLAHDFNSLAHALESHEQSRHQWIADISHELRTPLAILSGEIEALQDGIRPLNQHALKSLQVEVSSLGKLVDDLYQLTLSDVGALDYRKTAVEIAIVLKNTVFAFQARYQQQQLRLEQQMENLIDVKIWADESRLIQLFNNLLENSLRYTDKGGKLNIHAETDETCVYLYFEDTAPAVPDEALTHLFERLYRVDKSRSRALGGAGLGLAICHNIVSAHEGSITAYHASTGGLGIRIALKLI